MAQRHQHGHLRKAKRKTGPDVWEFLWRELGPNGKIRQRTLTVGNVKELPTKKDALNHIQMLRLNINRELTTSPLLTFDVLAKHYERTELGADGNKTPKTQEAYLAYLKNWILPQWGTSYLHSIKPVAVEHWLRSLKLSDGSKAKIRNIMSAVFSHAIRYELADRNPIRAVRQSAKRSSIPVVLEVSELHRLFDALSLRERSMVVTDALTGIRRGELMGLKWEDIDFIGQKINVVRSVVDCRVGACKTEASRKHVPMDEHIAQVLMTWRQESVYTERLGLGFSQQTRPRSLLAADHHAAIRPAGSQVCGHYQTHRLAHFPPHLFDSDQVARRRREDCPGTPASCVL